MPSLVVDALFAVINLDGFADIWRCILEAHRELFDPSEARAILEEARGLVHDSLVDGEPSDWQYNLGAALDMLRRLGASEAVPLTELLGVIRLHLVAHRWHIEHRGHDRFVDIRGRFLDCVARVVMGVEATDDELALMARPIGGSYVSTVGELIRRRRKALRWTQETLATAVGSDRSSVVHWEADRHRPLPAHAAALARHLGGAPADYLA